MTAASPIYWYRRSDFTISNTLWVNERVLEVIADERFVVCWKAIWMSRLGWRRSLLYAANIVGARRDLGQRRRACKCQNGNCE
jgi:hypothetical protein